ncbi:ragulator complex protein LAMTOR1 [Patella vulgata]|uniref:ragulator complex protein LAMTOR1 n=1 Tax=Patella vulgata TaxID=6465 RepID=UPI0021806FC0|nr:ragulator complex protein LAMTOR1 [Patella vulgata]
MGCCFSEEEEPDYGPVNPNERTPLIDPSVSNQQAINQDRSNSTYQQPPKGDEQSALNRILHKNAREVIDVTADSQILQQSEYHDRQRQYSNRLNMVITNSGRQQAYHVNLPPGVTSAHTVLSAPPVSSADILLIINATEKAAKCIKDIKVQHKEDLVASFGVP